ncbi:ABC transporter ATP-binding protein [Phaeovibrio sulfidiphilus]|uniref:ABC transporter ATP-binding protein n=1 Tax=Phaeovibrio sulfidiphilus TaxID=1220600 RepID=A0A8J7CWW5_9PROT|nr:ABC transporter ATP-binding protein [Phaeovibrio sulfidiphilus]MBE1237996.1 ABC transporter ATP-binding protein [Phaeovibrio sulfidiphilus]
MITSFLGFDLSPSPESRFGRGLVLGTLGACVDALPWFLLALALGSLAGGGLPEPGDIALVAALGVAGLVAGSLFKAAALNENFRATYTAVAHARLDLANHIARLPAGTLLSRRDGALADLLTARFAIYQDIITHVWGLVIAGVALPVSLFGLLVWLDWRLALVNLAFLPLALAAIPWSYRLLDRAGAHVSRVRDGAVAGVVEALGAARDARFFDPQGSRIKSVHADLDALRSACIRTETAPAPALLAWGLVLNLATVGVIGFATLVRDPSGTPVLVLIAAFLIALRLNNALVELGLYLAELRFSRTILGQIRAVFLEPALPEPASPVHPSSFALRGEDVTFSFGPERAIDSVSFDIQPGTVTALVGPSGAGKSTLASLMARLWDVDGGRITIGGVDLRDMDARTLNETVSMVLQDITLFDLSVRDNIRFGRPDAPPHEVEAAARAACIHDRIVSLPEGYDTLLSADTVLLSGGERQRLAIARALLKNAPVLILDEATSSLDLENEALVQRALNALCAERTVVAIAHRLWTIRNADQILVLDKGRIIERGRHDELLALDGLYAHLWRAQNAPAPASAA